MSVRHGRPPIRHAEVGPSIWAAEKDAPYLAAVGRNTREQGNGECESPAEARIWRGFLEIKSF